MSLASIIKQNARRLSDRIAGTPDFFRQSPVGIALLRDLEPLLAAHLRGRVLDAGAGRLGYRAILAPHAEVLVFCDRAVASADLDAAADLQALPFADGVFDGVFCSQVLEHVPDPFRAAGELARVLRPGGALVLTVPLLGYLHNEPHDYYRYTPHGVRVLLEQAGLEPLAMAKSGGPVAFGAHVAATAFTALTCGIPVLGPVLFRLTTWANALAEAVDRALPFRRLLPVNVIAVARKSSGNL